jgi:hypothetical protein
MARRSRSRSRVEQRAVRTLFWKSYTGGMTTNQAHDHHYAPQFYLRNFAVDPEKKKITTVAKNGSHAVWTQRSIVGIGFEQDLYVHLERGVPVSVEDDINKRIENPISKSDTWAKIANGQTDVLDRSDKPILYALIRHLEARTPHYLATARELALQAASSDSTIPFTEEEREMYAFQRADPNHEKMMFDLMSASMEWTANQYAGCALSILRAPVPLRASTTPVLATPAAEHPALHLSLPGMVPYQLVLALNANTIATLVFGDFDGEFTNHEIDVNIARAFNRSFAWQFSHFENVRHLITNRDDALIMDMTWAPYDLVRETDSKIIFRRRDETS